MATTEDPRQAGCPAGSWSLSDLALTIANEACRQEAFQAHLRGLVAAFCALSLLPLTGALPGPEVLPELPLLPMSRSTIWRILQETDIKPHKSVYWLTSHDPDFEAKSQEICRLYLNAPAMWQEGKAVICTDERTGILIRQRLHPSMPVRPGEPHRVEHEYVRRGMRHVIASFGVATGQVVYDATTTHNSLDMAAHLEHAAREMPEARQYHWVMDNVNTHWSLAVCEVVARLNRVPFSPRQLKTGKQRREFLTDPRHDHVFHFTPKHGSWLNQVEMFFSVFSRRFCQRDDFACVEDFLLRLEEWMSHYNTYKAHPYKWTYAGTPLVRDTPFEKTRRQQKRGRAFFSTRPKCFERTFFSPRPYRKPALA
jgi:hypothetical protein